jgi:transcriptional regulator with XRE-family HTH domain
MAGEQITIQQAFGHVLRRRRVAAGFSQEQLALTCGLDRTFISLLERGLRQPTLTTLFVLAEALHVRPSKLIASVETQLAD